MLYAYAEGPRALTRPSGPYNWPRPMFSARERGFGPEEADFSYSWPNPRFSAREGRYGAQVGDADGLGTLGDGKGLVLHAYAMSPDPVGLTTGPDSCFRLEKGGLGQKRLILASAGPTPGFQLEKGGLLTTQMPNCGAGW